MTMHSFDTEIAAEVGINAAIIYQNILFWTEKNAANDRHVNDGHVWTYNSVKAWKTLFPYMTASQIRRSLEKLVQADLVAEGNYNQSAYDRTKWYGVKTQIHLSKRENGVVQNRKPIPDSKPVTKPDITDASCDADLFSEKKHTLEQASRPDPVKEGFEQFWNDWPSHTRKAQKKVCAQIYAKACTGKHPQAVRAVTPDELNAAAKAYADSVEEKYLKGTAPWLRAALWEPFLGKDAKSERKSPLKGLIA